MSDFSVKNLAAKLFNSDEFVDHFNSDVAYHKDITIKDNYGTDHKFRMYLRTTQLRWLRLSIERIKEDHIFGYADHIQIASYAIDCLYLGRFGSLCLKEDIVEYSSLVSILDESIKIRILFDITLHHFLYDKTQSVYDIEYNFTYPYQDDIIELQSHMILHHRPASKIRVNSPNHKFILNLRKDLFDKDLYIVELNSDLIREELVYSLSINDQESVMNKEFLKIFEEKVLFEFERLRFNNNNIVKELTYD